MNYGPAFRGTNNTVFVWPGYERRGAVRRAASSDPMPALRHLGAAHSREAPGRKPGVVILFLSPRARGRASIILLPRASIWETPGATGRLLRSFSNPGRESRLPCR